MELVIKMLEQLLERLKWQQEIKVKNTNIEYARQVEKAIEILKNYSNSHEPNTATSRPKQAD